MSFEVPADAYDRFMGRFSQPLAPLFADFAGVSSSDHRVLDVGCGPGALTSVLAEALGEDGVAAIDPSQPFVTALGDRLPSVDVRLASANAIPFPDGGFDRALAQLVVHFMPDPVAGVQEMARVTRAGGTVAACVWDHAGRGGPLTAFWDAAHQMDDFVHDEAGMPGASEGSLAAIFTEAGLGGVVDSSLEVVVGFRDFDEWWIPFTLGVGPAGRYVAGLDEERREKVRALCAQLLPSGPFEIRAMVWAVRGTAGS
jgi:SAM-dependent methyltransferase